MSLWTRIEGLLYNLDRAGASLFGAPPQETVSSQAGRAARRGSWWGRALCWGLNKVVPGHCENAIKHADKLDKADQNGR